MENSAYRDAADRRSDTTAPAKDTDALRSAADQLPVNGVEFGSGWYHDVAIKESEQPATRKH